MRHIITIIASCFVAAPLFGQGLIGTRVGMPSKSFAIAAPIYLGEEYGARIEYNLYGGTVAIEGVRISSGEEYNQTEVDEDGLSLITEGYEGTLHVSRYSRPWEMGGFYWTLGMGYRVLDARWRRPLEDSFGVASDENALESTLTASGFTGHGRLGYRYVSEGWPVYIGGLVGIRHYENKFEDKESDNPGQTPTTDDERLGLRRMMMTGPEFAVELGVTL